MSIQAQRDYYEEAFIQSNKLRETTYVYVARPQDVAFEWREFPVGCRVSSSWNGRLHFPDVSGEIIVWCSCIHLSFWLNIIYDWRFSMVLEIFLRRSASSYFEHVA
jgi:hypothetical protein